ncbi:MAG: SIS domain-containing protein, partial [Clostridia bacterium]|nr:SIS domain-containing protein [Clostridia bacterium]
LAFSAFELSRFQFNHIDEKTMLVAISQSGKSMEVIELVEKARPIATVVGIYNTEGCPLSQMAEFTLPIRANKEISITSKTFELTMLILNVLAHTLTGELTEAFWKELDAVAAWSCDWLANWEKNSKPLYDFAQGTLLFDLLANNASLATARQLSLAYREGLHNCTAVWECADYAHGQFHSSKLGDQYLAQMFFPVFADGTKEMKMYQYILDHGGRVMLYTTSDVPARDRTMVVRLPKFRESLMPMVESIAAETFLGMLFGPDWIKDH